MATTTDAAISRVIELLNADITHVGIGTGVFGDATSTLLTTETLRKASTNLIDGNTLVVEGYWDESEGNSVTYTEAGGFCDSATVTVETGTLFTGDTISVEKNSTQSLTVSIEILVEAVNT